MAHGLWRSFLLSIAAVIALLVLLCLVLVFGNALSVDQGKAVTGVINSVPESSYVPSSPVKIVTYNIAHSRGNSSDPRLTDFQRDFSLPSRDVVYRNLDYIAADLQEENADIVSLQEVDLGATWSFGVDQASYLAEKASYRHYAFACRWNVFVPFVGRRADGNLIFPFMRLKSGVAVLSRYPFEADSVPYSRAGFIGWLIGHNHYLDATFGLGGKRFRVIDAHLDSESEQRRESEALAIISGVREKALPAIVTGDLNAIMPAAKPSMRWRMFDNDTTMESFIDSGLFSIYMLGIDPADKSYLTGNTEELFKTVDYIVPTKDISIEEYYVVRAFGSDHLPVAAVVIV